MTKQTDPEPDEPETPEPEPAAEQPPPLRLDRRYKGEG